MRAILNSRSFVLLLAAASSAAAQAQDPFQQARQAFAAKDFAKAAAALEPAADDAKFADRASAHYWAGIAWRQANQPDKAAARFAKAAEAHHALAKDPGDKDLPAPFEGAVRARADQAEALLAAGKPKEALAASLLLSKEKWLSRSKSAELLAYVTGCAAAASDDAVTAARAFVRLAPFEQPLFGAHARFLLARLHHAAGDTTEALEHYEAVPLTLVKHVLAARKILQSNAEPVKDNPLEKARLEALVAAHPDFAGDALYHAGALLYEQKKYAEALERLTKIAPQHPKHARLHDAQMLAGLCLARLARHPEAVNVFKPLLDHPTHGAQARTWTARSLVRGTDPANAGAVKQALDQAAVHLRDAAALLSKTPEGAAQAADLLLELGDVLRRAGRPADAAAVYQQLVAGAQRETAQAKLVACLQSAGKAREAEAAFLQFEKDHPRSLLMAEALFHYAECAYGASLMDEAVKRYERLIAKFPDLPQANLCRYRVAMARHSTGHYAEAAAALGAIPDHERGGPLAGSSYVLADSLLRAGPPASECRDAVAAARRLQQFNLAIQALQASVAALQGTPELGDAMMKLGYCFQQVALLQAVPEERIKAATSGREVYEAIRATIAADPNHPLHTPAQLERANCYALANDIPTALTKMPRFHAEPLVKSPVAPMAFVRESQFLRQLGRAPEAVAVLADCRAKFEEELKKDAARAAWVPVIKLHHGVALKEAKQPAEAKKVLESVVKDHPDTDSARAAREHLEEIK